MFVCMKQLGGVQLDHKGVFLDLNAECQNGKRKQIFKIPTVFHPEQEQNLNKTKIEKQSDM